MGRSGLSSKRKYAKKKSLKVSSEARRKKRSRRYKSEKLRRHDDSFSSYSDDESSSSSLVSSSSSDSEYKRKRARSCSRNEVKGSRKRTRRSSSEESGKDSPPVKKRKGSKKKDDSETKKKRKKKKNKNKNKKMRRDAYISSTSSDSASCSTCRDGDSSSDEGATLGRRRGRSKEKKKDHHRDSIKDRNGNRKNRSWSRSSSPSKLSNSSDDDSIEKVAVENNSRRLKSVITVAQQPEEEEGNNMKKDELKEEIVYDYDDYPSCKSNDSNDGEHKKELVDHSSVSSEKRIGEVNSHTSFKDNKSVSPGKNPGKEYADSKEKESNVSCNIGSEVDNLESMLRQKALENLSRFRGRLQTKAVVPAVGQHESDQSSVKQSPTASINLVQTQSKLPASEQDGSSMFGISQPAIQRSRFTWRRDPSVATGKEQKAATYSGNDPGRPQAPASKLQSADLPSTGSVVNKSAFGTSKIMASTNNNNCRTGTSDAQKSTTALETQSCASTKEGTSNEQQTETKDNSQLEQKTMSVMRGGEMVQVSYKVYIPKKAPALARRQLKR